MFKRASTASKELDDFHHTSQSDLDKFVEAFQVDLNCSRIKIEALASEKRSMLRNKMVLMEIFEYALSSEEPFAILLLHTGFQALLRTCGALLMIYLCLNTTTAIRFHNVIGKHFRLVLPDFAELGSPADEIFLYSIDFQFNTRGIFVDFLSALPKLRTQEEHYHILLRTPSKYPDGMRKKSFPPHLTSCTYPIRRRLCAKWTKKLGYHASFQSSYKCTATV